MSPDVNVSIGSSSADAKVNQPVNSNLISWLIVLLTVLSLSLTLYGKYIEIFGTRTEETGTESPENSATAQDKPQGTDNSSAVSTGQNTGSQGLSLIFTGCRPNGHYILQAGAKRRNIYSDETGVITVDGLSRTSFTLLDETGAVVAHGYTYEGIIHCSSP